MGALQNTDDTLSVSPFGLPALPKGEPRALRAKVRTIQQSTTKNPGFRADAIRPYRAVYKSVTRQNTAA